MSNMNTKISHTSYVHGELGWNAVWHGVAAVMMVVAVTVFVATPTASLTTNWQQHEEKGEEKDSQVEAVLLWHRGVVPYMLGDSITAAQKSIILQAMDDFHNKTCIRFTERHNEKDYIEIHSDRPGCTSSVGRAGGRQMLHLNAAQCMQVGTVIHELMHILGLFHEHAREDSTNYITINMQNVIPDMRLDFLTVPGMSLGVRYNYESILHYGPYAFSKKPGIKKTIVPKDPDADIKDPWQRTEMADTDAMYIHKLYQDECQ